MTKGKTNNTLIERMMKTGALSDRVNTVSDSTHFKEKDYVKTDIPIVNIAFSGSLDGGLVNGLTVLAGESKTFKSMMGLICMKSYLDKYEDGVAIFYDSEFGITPEYMKSLDIDTDRVIHVPIVDIEELKFDFTQRLGELTKSDNVFFLVDSLGNLASKKEVQDAEDGKSVQDMTRAKQIKSLFRIITPHFSLKEIPCVIINHTYKEQGMFPKDIVSGGQGVMLSANQVFITTKAQEKDGTELKGFKFTLNVEKSRFVKEKSKLPFRVMYEGGINKYSSLFELALESGHIIKSGTIWYEQMDPETGEVYEKKKRGKEIQADTEYFDKLLKSQDFKDFVEKKYKLSVDEMRKKQERELVDPEDENDVDF